MYYNETKTHKNSHSGVNYKIVAMVMFALSMYLSAVILSNYDQIGEPWNYIAALTLCICNGLLSVLFFGDPEKDETQEK